LEHLRYYLTDVPPQPNSPVDNVDNRKSSPIGTANTHDGNIGFPTCLHFLQLRREKSREERLPPPTSAAEM